MYAFWSTKGRRLVRILVYEGTEEAIKENLRRSYISPDRPFVAVKDYTIHEVFRGWQQDPVVEHLDEEGPLAQEVDRS